MWDYQNKTCVQTLTGHTHNVSVACFHPELPIIITGSEDGMWLVVMGWLVMGGGLTLRLGRHGSAVARQHIQAGEHAQLRHGARLGPVVHARLEQCRSRL